MEKRFCASCKEENVMIRKEIKMNEIILLLFFTAGIGIFIYFLIYQYGNIRCCNKCGKNIKITEQEIKNQNNQSEQYNSVVPYSEPVLTQSQDEENQSGKSFCFLCGSVLIRENPNYCPNCGTELNSEVIPIS